MGRPHSSSLDARKRQRRFFRATKFRASRVYPSAEPSATDQRERVRPQARHFFASHRSTHGSIRKDMPAARPRGHVPSTACTKPYGLVRSRASSWGVGATDEIAITGVRQFTPRAGPR